MFFEDLAPLGFKTTESHVKEHVKTVVSFGDEWMFEPLILITSEFSGKNVETLRFVDLF